MGGANGVPTFFSRSGVWKVSRNFLTWSLRSWSMLRASMARLRNSSTSSSGLRASWAPRLEHGKGGVKALCGPPRLGPLPKTPSTEHWGHLLVLAGVIDALGRHKGGEGGHQGHWQGLGGGPRAGKDGGKTPGVTLGGGGMGHPQSHQQEQGTESQE